VSAAALATRAVALTREQVHAARELRTEDLRDLQQARGELLFDLEASLSDGDVDDREAVVACLREMGELERRLMRIAEIVLDGIGTRRPLYNRRGLLG